MNATLYSLLSQTLQSGRGAVLVRIVRRKGSAPRGVGSICLVGGDAILAGSIGGGLVEFRAVEEAKALLERKRTSVRAFAMTAEEISDEGMICGGSVELFFEPILPDDTRTVAFFQNLADLVRSGGEGTLVTRIRHDGAAAEPDCRMLIPKDGGACGAVPGLGFPGHVRRAELIQQEGTGTTFFLEPIAGNPTLLLFGGGHISTFISPLAKTLGFHVTVLDDRSDFANRDRFPEADEIISMDYREACATIAVTGSSFIVIVTRGHGSDRDILERLLKSDASPAYIGMIGSKRKRDTIYGSLMDSGISAETLGKVYSPIGLDIGAHTPEEIAVSIMAEIIRVKAAGR